MMFGKVEDETRELIYVSYAVEEIARDYFLSFYYLTHVKKYPDKDNLDLHSRYRF